MSTKIYDGVCIRTTSTKKLKSFIDRLYSSLKEKRNELVYKRIADNFVCTYDKITLASTQAEKELAIKDLFHWSEETKDISNIVDYGLVSFIDKKLAERHNKVQKTMERDPSCDFHFAVSFTPHKNKILCIPYYEQRSFLEIFNSFEEVEEYGYWNNTDQPEDISNREWNRREKDWEEALGWNAPAQMGFTWELNKKHTYRFLDFWEEDTLDNLLTYLPSFEERVEDRSTRIVYQRKSKELSAFKEDDNDISFLFDTSDYVKSEDGLKEIGIEKKRVATLLKREFTVEDLKNIKIQDLIA